MLKYLLLLFLAGSMAACKAMEERQADFAAVNNRFIDKSSDELVLLRGVPSATFTLSTGERVFEYRRSQRQTSGGYSYPVMTPMWIDGKRVNVPGERRMPATSVVYACRLAFTVSVQNVVTGWRNSGNGCF